MLGRVNKFIVAGLTVLTAILTHLYVNGSTIITTVIGVIGAVLVYLVPNRGTTIPPSSRTGT